MVDKSLRLVELLCHSGVPTLGRLWRSQGKTKSHRSGSSDGTRKAVMTKLDQPTLIAVIRRDASFGETASRVEMFLASIIAARTTTHRHEHGFGKQD